MFEDKETPARPVTDVGLALIAKSCDVNATVVETLLGPFVPVTVTVYTPEDPEQDRVEVPEAPRVILVEDRVQLRPVLGEIEETRLTVPVNPLCAATVMVDVPVAPARTVRVVGLAVRVYGVPELTVTVAIVVSPLPVPVTVTLKVPGVDEAQDRVDAAVPPLMSVTLVDDRLQISPADGEMAVVRVTVPANPSRLVTVIPEFPAPPEGKLRVVGLAVTVKSWTVYVTVAE